MLGVAALVWLFVATWQVWLLAFTGARHRQRHPAGRPGSASATGCRARLTVLVVYLVVAGIVALMGRLLWPALSEQWQQFMDQLPRLIDNVKGWVGDLQVLFGQWGATVSAPKTDNLQAVAGALLANTVRADRRGRWAPSSSCWRCW